MEALPNYGLANTVTGFATMFSGVLPLLLCRMVAPQPARWLFVYWMIVVTGVFTVTLHGFGETNPVLGARWFWGFLDTGSNIVVAWSLALAVLGDYFTKETWRWAPLVVTIAMLVGVDWHFVDRLPDSPRNYLVPLGDWGGFYPGESWLIAFCWFNVALFASKWRDINGRARPLLLAVLVVFFCGMLLATASNDRILYPFLPLHALWHLVSAYGFILLWAFNHVRLHEPQPASQTGV